MVATAQPVNVVDPERVAPWSRPVNPSTPVRAGSADTDRAAVAVPRRCPESLVDNTSNVTEEFEDFFVRVLPRTLRAVRRLTGDPKTAEEIAVNALARAHSRWARIAPLPWRDAWVLKAASQEALRIRRHPHMSARGDRDEPGAAATAPRDLVACLCELPRREQEVVVLRFVCDLAEPDIALALGTSARAVRALLRRARASQRAKIGADIEEVLVHELYA
jgi:RNA polymerase sigma factor (sigma-70 family)